MNFEPTDFKLIAENIVLVGAALTALFYGIRHMYKIARNIEKLVETSEENKRNSALSREAQNGIKNDLVDHIRLSDEQSKMRDLKFDKLAVDMAELASDLRTHTKTEEDRDLIRDQQLIQLTDHMDEVIAEMRPNGGSSMKDILTCTNKNVNSIHTRVAVLEQWQDDLQLIKKRKKAVARKKKPRQMVRKSGRR